MARSLRSPAPLVELGHHARRRLAAALRHTRLLTAVLSTAVLAHAPVALAQPALPDTLYTLSNGFDRSDASCSVRGWVAENRAPVVYAHVSDRFLVNSPFYGGVSSPGAVIVFTGQAATSQLSVPRASAIDAAGNVLFSDFAPAGGIAVYEVRPDGSMVQFAIFTPTTLVLYCMVRDPLNGRVFLVAGRKLKNTIFVLNGKSFAL